MSLVPMLGGVLDGESNLMFANRAPIAVAIQMAVVLAHAAECQLATVEDLEGRKSTSKADLRRHRIIADELVRHCQELHVPPRGLMGSPCPRLRERLERGHSS